MRKLIVVLQWTFSIVCFLASISVYADSSARRIQSASTTASAPASVHFKKVPTESTQEFEISEPCTKSKLCGSIFAQVKEIESKSGSQTRTEYVSSLQVFFKGFENRFLSGHTESEHADVISFASGLQSIFEYALNENLKTLNPEEAQCRVQLNTASIKIKNYFLDVIQGKTYFINSRSWDIFKSLIDPICGLKN